MKVSNLAPSSNEDGAFFYLNAAFAEIRLLLLKGLDYPQSAETDFRIKEPNLLCFRGGY